VEKTPRQCSVGCPVWRSWTTGTRSKTRGTPTGRKIPRAIRCKHNKRPLSCFPINDLWLSRIPVGEPAPSSAEALSAEESAPSIGRGESDYHAKAPCSASQHRVFRLRGVCAGPLLAVAACVTAAPRHSIRARGDRDSTASHGRQARALGPPSFDAAANDPLTLWLRFPRTREARWNQQVAAMYDRARPISSLLGADAFQFKANLAPNRRRIWRPCSLRVEDPLTFRRWRHKICTCSGSYGARHPEAFRSSAPVPGGRGRAFRSNPRPTSKSPAVPWFERSAVFPSMPCTNLVRPSNRTTGSVIA